MAIAPGDVTSLLRKVLEHVETAAVARSVDLPDRRYVTTGGAVYDCAQVTVSANQILTGIAAADTPAGAPSGAVGNCPPGWYVALELAIVDKVVGMTQGRRAQALPDVADLEADTDMFDQYAGCLTDAVESLAGPGWDQYGNVPCSLQFGEVSGGFGAVILSISLNLWIQADS